MELQKLFCQGLFRFRIVSLVVRKFCLQAIASGEKHLKEPLVVALDDRRYEIERPWAAQPSTSGSGCAVTDIAIDRADRLYVLNRFDRYVDPPGKPAVAVYSSEGVLEQTFELPDLSDGHGISIGPNGEIIVVDRDRHVVHVLDQNGQVLLTLGERNEPGRPFSHPTCARIAPGGDIFVCDGYGNSKIGPIFFHRAGG